MNRDEMIKRLKGKLNDKRFVHSVGVEYTAATLAFVHGADVEKARIAGLLHDCAKCLPAEEKLRKAKKHGLPINRSEKLNPDLLHGKLGAYYAKRKYDVKDEEILSAITYHTTGHPDMTLLEKIIFVADYIEPNRKMVKDMEEIRKEAYEDIDKCIIHILKNTLDYLNSKKYVVDEITEQTYYFYVDKMHLKEIKHTKNVKYV
ncbi:MAG: bis(5'-nucleosyl)-tetraphosphatase (symmetrical) YqeK [Eubacterium sp.]|nr:bis(5'-nucleosyl)-tetraphosphatase (symmetrical) YqeK [Eubacterium sp.]